MNDTAADRSAVLADTAVAARTAQLTGTVDRAEGGCREGDEEAGSAPDCDRHVLAADQARADEVEGVARVEAGAGHADGCAAVAAADKEAFSWFVAGVVVVKDLAGRTVQKGGRAGQVDRV